MTEKLGRMSTELADMNTRLEKAESQIKDNEALKIQYEEKMFIIEGNLKLKDQALEQLTIENKTNVENAQKLGQELQELQTLRVEDKLKHD